MNIPGFSENALAAVNAMLYREGQDRPLEGQCNQEKKEQAKAEPRSPEEKKADTARAQASTGQDSVPAGTRSDAAKKAAETRSKCPGNNTSGGPK
jgi:hypothetical protein